VLILLSASFARKSGQFYQGLAHSGRAICGPVRRMSILILAFISG
jgi:hypothetical protein